MWLDDMAIFLKRILDKIFAIFLLAGQVSLICSCDIIIGMLANCIVNWKNGKDKLGRGYTYIPTNPYWPQNNSGFIQIIPVGTGFIAGIVSLAAR